MNHRIFGIGLAAILGFHTICNAQDTLPQWQEGYLDIHCIASGQGESHFYVMPDGTTMLVDAGDVGDVWTHNHWPDDTKGAGEWIAEYVKYFTPDAVIASDGKTEVDYFLLTHFHSDHMGNMWNPESGIIAAGKTLHFDKIVDRGYPAYDFPSRKKLEDKVVAFPYEAWVNACVKAGSKAERFDIGSRKQFALKHKRGGYDFEIYNIAASGRCHTGKGKGSVPMWPDGFPLDRYDENVMSCVHTVRYGPFKYYNGGDLGGGNYSLKTMLPRNFEQKVAPLVGNVTAMVLDHHGCMDSTNPEFLWTLSPDVIIVPCAEKSHPYTDTFDRIMNPSNPGRRDMYITGEVSRPVLGEARWARIKPFGHIVIRVYDKGEKYRVYVLDPLSYDYKVKYVSPEFSSVCGKNQESAGGTGRLNRSFEELPLGSIKPDGWLRPTQRLARRRW